MLRTLSAFYSTILHRRRLEALEGQLAAQKQMLTTVRERARIGRSVALDVLQIRTQVAVLEPTIAEARNLMETSSAELATLIGEREASTFRLRGSLESFDWKAVVEESRPGLEALPELRRAEVLQAEVEDRKDVVLGKHWPSVDLVGAWGRSSYVKSELLDERASAWNFGVEVAIPLFSGLSSIHERRQLAARARQAQIEATRARDSTALEQVKARKALETAVSVQVSRKAAFELSRELLREAQRSYRLSTVDYAQFLAAQRAAYEAELAHEQASHDFIQAMARYMAASGMKLDALIRTLDSRGDKT
jgi:outer membrane protein TolC